MPTTPATPAKAAEHAQPSARSAGRAPTSGAPPPRRAAPRGRVISFGGPLPAPRAAADRDHRATGQPPSRQSIAWTGRFKKPPREKRGHAPDTNDICPAPCVSRRASACCAPTALAVGYDGAAILPPLSLTIARRRAVGGHRPQRRGQIDVRAHRAGPACRRSRARSTRAPGLRLAYVPQQSRAGRHLPDLGRRLRADGPQGAGQRDSAWRSARRRAPRAAALDEAGAAGARAPPAARPVGRPAPARADCAGARHRRRPGRSSTSRRPRWTPPPSTRCWS